MMAIVLGDLALLPSGDIWVLGCDCIRPRRCMVINRIQTKKLKGQIIKDGTPQEVRGPVK